MNDFTSEKMRFWAFVSMVLLVFVHAYNLNNRYLQPFTIVDEPLTVNSFVQYFTANGLFRFRIPMLFVISGYLFALHDTKPYGKRMTKRLRTLFVPYLIWSALGLLLTWGVEQYALTQQAVQAAQLQPFGEKRIAEYAWNEWLVRWLLSPMPFQLWFLRSLLVYNAAYPLLVKAVQYPRIWFSCVAFLWVASFYGGLFEGEGLLFFSLGIWLQKRKDNIAIIKHAPSWFNLQFWSVSWIILTAGKTVFAFYGFMWFGSAVFPILIILHKIVVLMGLFVCWYGLDAVVQWCMNQRWFVYGSAFSFMIYGLHVPLVNYCLQPTFVLLHDVPHYRLLAYVFIPMILISFCILVGMILRRVVPSFYALLTGGRGLY